MSIAGLILRRGSTCTVKRPSDTTNADGSADKSWATITTAEHVLIDHAGDEVIRRVFGEETRGNAIGRFSAAADIQIGDGLEITAGPFTGRRFKVARPQLHALFGSQHLEAALVETTEAFA